MQKLRKQKGITLIALIITIIVMLILVGVTVSVSLNGGLFEKTKQAGSDMQREVDRETLYELVLASIGNDGKVDFTVLDGKVEGTAELFTKIADKKYQSKKGNTFTVGDYGQITYEGESDPVTPPDDNPPADDPDIETVAVASFEQNGTTITGKDADGNIIEGFSMSVGEQIAYDCYDETLTDEQKAELLYHKATVAETGNTTQDEYGAIIGGGDGTEPEFLVTANDESRAWNILGVENGKLIITTDPIDTSLKIHYSTNSASNTDLLNNISAIYGHGKHAESARSIKMSDVTKLTGATISYPEPSEDEKNGNQGAGIFPELETDSFLNHDKYGLVDGTFFLNDFKDATRWGPSLSTDTDEWYMDGWAPVTFIYYVSNGLISQFTMHDAAAGAIYKFASSSYVKPVVTLNQNISLGKDANNVWQFGE